MGEASGWFSQSVQWVLDSEWVHQFILIVLIALICWAPAKLIVAKCFPVTREEGTGMRLFRGAIRASVWPLLALLAGTVALRVGQTLQPEYFGTPDQILAVLGVFLVFRIVDRVMRSVGSNTKGQRAARRTLVLLLFLLFSLHQLGWLSETMEFLQRPLISTGRTTVTSLSIIAAIGGLFLMIAVSGMVQRYLTARALPMLGIDPNLSDALSTVARYVLVIVGVFWALNLLGFDLSTIGIALGALGVGIGMGLQGIVNNFVSGLILMFERSIKRGDVLSVGGTAGRVQRIGMRASVIRSREGEDLIMPNSNFTSDTIINYSFGDDLTLVDVPVGVSYEADPNTVRDLLIAVAVANERILDHPAPLVRFQEFGASSLDFQLRAWIHGAWDLPRTRSTLLFEIWYALKEHGIEIPYPQRDLHVRSGELKVKLTREDAAD